MILYIYLKLQLRVKEILFEIYLMKIFEIYYCNCNCDYILIVIVIVIKF